MKIKLAFQCRKKIATLLKKSFQMIINLLFSHLFAHLFYISIWQQKYNALSSPVLFFSRKGVLLSNSPEPLGKLVSTWTSMSSCSSSTNDRCKTGGVVLTVVVGASTPPD